MKSAIAGSFIWLSLSLLFCLPAAGQQKTTVFKSAFFPEMEIGAAFPVHQQTKDVFAAGLHVSAGGRVAFLSENFFIKPVVGAKWYYKEIEKQNAVTEHLRTFKAGLELQYRVLENNTFGVYPLLRVDYNRSANYFSETYYYGLSSGNPNDYRVEKSDNLFYGSGVSADVGGILRFKALYAKLHFEFYQPSLRLNDQIVQEMHYQGFYVAPYKKFNFNSVNISVGTSLNFFR